MSRQVFLFLLLMPTAAPGQSLQPGDRTSELVENARKLAAVDADGCLKSTGSRDCPFPNWPWTRAKESGNPCPAPIPESSSRVAAM